MRVAIYARFSTQMQREASIEDQLRICRRLIAASNWREVRVYADKGISGATHLRPGYQQMLEDGRRGVFDMVVAESIDRISRDQEHVAGFHKQMVYAGIGIVTVAEGPINELHIGLKGTMSALYIKDLAQKTHRGLEGRVRAGKAAGGLSYGYRLDRQPLPDGSFTTGDRRIHPDEAGIVKEIFGRYAAGDSARTIAIWLNSADIAGPRGGKWSFSTISGNWKRGTGILNNELYIGRLVWNRQRFIKDPETGKRQARLNPAEDWVIEDVPELRLIEDDLWQEVKRRQGAIRETILTAKAENPGAPHAERGRRAKYLFSGLIKCGCCGANHTLVADQRYGCSAARNKGTCDNRKTITRAEIENRVLAGLKDRLMAPELLSAFISEYQREWRAARQAARTELAQSRKRLGQVTREIENMVTAIANGMFHPSMKGRMDKLEAEKAELETQIEAQDESDDPLTFHPRLGETYARQIGALITALGQDGARGEAAQLIRGLVERINVEPTEDGHNIALHGELGAILSLCGDAGGVNDNARLVAGAGSVTLVAGVGFEPTTFRL